MGLSDGIGRESKTSAHAKFQIIKYGNHVVIQYHLYVTLGRNALAALDPWVGKGLPISISNGEYLVVEDGVIVNSANTAGNTFDHFFPTSPD